MTSAKSFLPEVKENYGEYFYKEAKAAIEAGHFADDENLLDEVEAWYQEMMEQSDGGRHTPNGG